MTYTWTDNPITTGTVDVWNQCLMYLKYDNLSTFKGCLVKRSTDLAIPNAVVTTINFDQEDYDTNSIHDNSTNNTRLTVPVGVSKVRVTATAQFPNAGGSLRSFTICKNGAPPYPVADVRGVIATTMYMHLSSPVISVISGDYFEVLTYQDSGSTLTINKDYLRFGLEIVE